MIFFFRLNAILINSFETGALDSEVASTWKLIKQFHLRANAPNHTPNAKPRDLLTVNSHKEAQKAENYLDGIFWLLFLAGPYYDALARQ
jgi:hypothetical protein